MSRTCVLVAPPSWINSIALTGIGSGEWPHQLLWIHFSLRQRFDLNSMWHNRLMLDNCQCYGLTRDKNTHTHENRRECVSNSKKCEHRICRRPIRLTFSMRNKALNIHAHTHTHNFYFLSNVPLSVSHSHAHLGISSLPFSASHLHAILKYCFREIDDVVSIAVAVSPSPSPATMPEWQTEWMDEG